MSPGVIIKKEIKELLTPATILPILVLSLIFGSMGNMIGGIEEKIAETPILGLINNDTGEYSDFLTTYFENHSTLVYTGNNPEEGIARVQNEGGVALIIIPSTFSSYIHQNQSGIIQVHWVMKGAGVMDSISSGVVDTLLADMNYRLSQNIIETEAGVNSTIILNPLTKNETTIFKGKEMPGVSPGMISSMLSSQSIMVPIVIMMIIIMAGGTVISSMGLEKENKTLETLLTLPVNRASIVAGKIAGSAIVGLIMAVIYMVGFGYYMQSLTVSELDLEKYGLTLGWGDYLLVGLSLFVTILAGLSLCMILGTFAKNYKSAQALTFPITGLAMIPMFLIMFKDFDTLPLIGQIVLFMIPFSHPMMAMRALMFDDYSLVIGGIVYVTVFTIISIAIAVYIFKTDRILTGRMKKNRGSKKFFTWIKAHGR
jgi:ABC-2 type transport system permease protein